MNEIRLATAQEYDPVSAFIDEHWKKNHAYVRSKSLFDWTFLNNPNWDGNSYSISLALNNGEIEGMLGTIPFDLNVYGESSKGCWLVNWLVLQQARKGRTGLKLLDVFQKDLGYQTISFGINDTIARLYSALQWQEMPPMPRVVWINPEFVRGAEVLLREVYPDVDDSDIVKFVRDHASKLSLVHESGRDSFDSVWGKEWDDIGWGKLKERTIGCSRDTKYLTWRYLEHPIYRYDSIVVSDGINLGLLIWRVDSVADRTSPAHESFRFARIVEFLPNSEVNAFRLVSSLINHMKDSGIQVVDFYCYNNKIMKLISKMGFVVSRELAGIQFPNHTQPIVEGSSIRSAIKLHDSLGLVSTLQDWYWTKSDSDQDRPI